MRRPVVSALCSSPLLLMATVMAQGDQPERLPEPAHQFAKDAAQAVTQEERAWLKRADELDTVCSSGTSSAPGARPLPVEAAALLARSRRVLAAYRSTDRDLRRYQALLQKAAGHYREVAELYVTLSGSVKSGPVREDYAALIDTYRHRAASMEARAHAAGLSPALADQAALLEESNHFLGRLAEVTAAVPVGEADERLLAARLRRHAGQCETLAQELARAVRAVLTGSDDPQVRQRATTPTQKVSVAPKALAAAESPRPTTARKRDQFPLIHIVATGDWAGVSAGPTELSVGDNLICERPGVGPVGTLRLVSYSPDGKIFVVHAVGGTRFVAGDSARR
jgi:hypothetical protein